MTVRRLGSDGDIVTRGRQFTSGKTEIAQTIKTRLRLFSGEYFRNITEGTPWYQSILGKGASLSQREALIRRRIAETPGVRQVVELSTDFDLSSRTYAVSATVETDQDESVEVQVNG